MKQHDPQAFAGIVDARRALAPIVVRDGHGVREVAFPGNPTEASARGFYETFLRMRDLVLMQTEEIVRARIDHGRWLADCPNCLLDAALPVVGLTRACCLGCGCYFLVIFPDREEMTTGEQALSSRPVELRNWNPALQDAGDLGGENSAHGVPGGDTT